MADPENRRFHVVAVVLALVAGVAGHGVTSPHPRAWLFAVVAAFAVLVPAEVAYFVLNGGRRRPEREGRQQPRPAAAFDHYSLLGRALTALRTVKPGEKELLEALQRAVEVLEDHDGVNTPAVVELRVTVKQTAEKLERHARDENPDPVMLGLRLQVLRDNVEDATAAVEPR
ncbi:hypothetical protein [Amycolatopsis pittospori]|uniref:hypothetical protein n=1 Tax=Amycolatopsis pittospori TaxID=2749434 RepID=UPI0015F0E486|nr:hypothetical protein [Amycolatopsis pittospori]